MANNLIQVKRTSVSGRAANSTTLPNPGELALNMSDGILYSTNGSTVFEIGANNTNARVSGTLTVNAVSANGGVGANNQRLTSNGSVAYWKDPLIKDLTDVAANGATDTQVLTYNSTLSKWVNQNPPVANVVYTTGYYGVFYDVSNQFATGGSNTATVTRIANTFLSNGLTSTANNEMQIAYSGVYRITYSLQFTSSSNKNETIWVWLRKNGVDVPESTTDFGVYAVSGGTNGYIVAVTSLVDDASAGDKFQVMWATSDNTVVSMAYMGTTAFSPEIPSAIIDVVPISNIITAPPGGNTDVTFNDSGLANGAAGFTYNKTTNSVFVANNLNVGNTVNAAAFNVGVAFQANSTIVNAAALLVRGEATVNQALTVNATTINSSGIYTTNVTGNLTGNVVATNVNTAALYVNTGITLNNDNQLRFKTVNSAAHSYFVQQNDDNFVLYTTSSTYAPRPVWSIYANSSTSAFGIGTPVNFSGANVNLGTTTLYANGTSGTAGQVLTSNGTATYWSAAGSGSVDVNAQYTWTNTHTFSSNVSFTGNGIGIASNTGAIYLGGINDANWKIARNAGVSTKWKYTNNTIDIVTANSNLEGMTIGLVNGNSYFETGYLGTFIASNVTVGNSSSNISINSTAFVGNVVATSISGNLTGNVVAMNISGNLTGNVSATTIVASGDVITGRLQHSPVAISKLLTGFDTADSDGFGRLSLSGDGSVLAIGAPGWEGATGTNRGGVYIYDWNGSNWIQRGSVLEAADAADTDQFGVSTSLNSNGTVLVVGAPGWEGATGTNRGGVYIYDWNGSSWIQRGSVLEAADAADSDSFGRVSLSGDASILVVSALQWEGATGTNRGGVYTYDWNGSSWVQRGSVLEAADAADSDSFGTISLSSDGTVLAVGANGWEGATGTDRGGVYIYDWNGSAWIQRGSVLEAADAADSDNFYAVSLNSNGSVLAVGASNWEGATGSNRGGVYIYDWNGSNWVQRGSVLEASDAADGDSFSINTKLSSDASILVVSAVQWEGATGTGRGAVYTYSLTGALPSYSGVATGSGWIEGANSTLIGRTAGLDRITLDISGNVGIGNTAPDATLAVTGTANVSGNSRFGGVSTFAANVILGSSAVSANGEFGTAGQVLHSNGTATYWDTDDQGVTSVASGDGLTGGPITATGTLSVLANTGIVANTSGLFVNAAYINTISAAELGGFAAAAYVKNTDTRILSGNLNFTGANNYFTVQVGVNNAVINSSGVYAPSLYGNLTGNVVATTISGNLTGNVVATTISGNLTGNVTATTITGNLTGNVVAGTVNATTINATSSIVVGANVSLNTSILQIGNSTVKTTVNTTAFIGNVVATTVTGNLTGNVVATTISGNLTGNVLATTLSGNLTAITANVTNKLQIGTPGSFDFGSNAVIEIDANGNTYVQAVVQNANTGNNASADLVVTNDTGNDSFNYVDLGINGSNYNQPGFNITGASDAYLYASHGNLAIGTATADKEIIFHAGGTTSDKRVVTVNSTALVLANSSALVANGSKGTAAQVLTSNGTGAYWSSSVNNALNLGGVAAASYQLNSTLNANVAAYLPTYTGVVNASTFQVGTAFKANTTDVVTANLTVQGNLIVTGTTVTLNTATLDVMDLNITLAKGTATAAAANGAGITVDVANATLLYINAGNTWLSNIGFAVGNSTSNVNINSTAFIGNVVAARVTANLTGNVTATTLTGNLTGNVAATTITGNLTGNVAAVTITGNLTGNVAATTITGNLTGNVVATTITGNLSGNVTATTVNATTINATANIVVGANVLVNTSTLAIGNLTANVFVNSTAFVGNTAGVHTGNVSATTLSGNLTGNVVAITITGNLTGNVIATTISGNLTGNVIATTITGNLTGNTSGTHTGAIVLGTSSLSANGGLGTAGHVLHSNGTATYWAADDQGVTSVASGNGITGGTITSTGTLSAVAGTGTVVNATGIHVNAAYIATISANAATYLNSATNFGNAAGITAPAFYDSANTTFVVDPATTTRLKTANIDTLGWNSIVPVFGQRGAYINELVDVLYQADKRFTLTNGSSSYFDGNFDSSVIIPVNTTRVININLAGQAGIPGAGITYSSGVILVSFYYTTNLYSSLSLRVKNNAGTWFTAAAPTDISTTSALKVMAFAVPLGNYLTDIELTVVTDATNEVWLASINYYCDRWTSELELPFASKYLNSNYFFGNLGVKNNSGVINNLLSGTSNSYLAATVGNLGIGNTTPTHKLHVTGTSYVSGNAGFGITPNTIFHVASGSSILKFPQTDGGDVGLQIESVASGHAPSLHMKNGTGYYRLAVHSSDASLRFFNGTDRVVVLQSGNVGIGNTTPAHTLSVNGPTNLAGAVTGITTLAAGNTTIIGFANVSVSVNSALYTVGSTVVANTTGTYATHLAGVAAASYVQNTDSRTLSGNLVFSGSNTTVNAVFRVANSTANVFFAAANGNIGIGTATPNSLITLDATSPRIGFYPNDSTYALYRTGTSMVLESPGYTEVISAAGTGLTATTGAIGFNTGTAGSATERMRVAANGNIGVGTTSPGVKLDVNGDVRIANGSSLYWYNYNSTTNGPRILGSNDNLTLESGPVGAGRGALTLTGHNNTTLQTDAGSLSLSASQLSAAEAYINFSTAGSERMRIANTGAVGIGSSAPAAKLEVKASSDNQDPIFQITEYRAGGAALAKIYESQDAGVMSIGYYGLAGSRVDINGGASGGASSIYMYNGASANVVLTASGNSYFTGGNVGIGTSAPSYKLHVNGAGSQDVYISSSDNSDTGLRFAGAGARGRIYADASYNMFIQPNAQYNNPYVIMKAVNDSVNQIRVGINTTTPGYTLQVNGSFAATTKSFVIDHPTKPDMKLRYGSLEGPENGVYVRGKSTSRVIELPDYWEGLVDEDSITVTLTAIGKKQRLYVKEIRDNAVVIGGSWKPNYFYTVYAERKDVEKLVVEF